MISGITGSNLLVVFALMGTLFDTISRLPRDVAESVEDQAGTLVVSLGILAGGWGWCWWHWSRRRSARSPLTTA
jgi:hypothetical protein